MEIEQKQIDCFEPAKASAHTKVNYNIQGTLYCFAVVKCLYLS